jgi:predicted peptidase
MKTIRKMIRLFSALMTVLGASSALANGARCGFETDSSLEPWKAESFKGLPYRLLLPANYNPSKKYPLVVYLHGSGESGNDNRLQLKNGVELFATQAYRERYESIVLVPQNPPHDSWGGLFYGGETETQRKVIALVDQISRNFSVDLNRRYLTGVSMGAIGGWDIVARHPKLFAAFLPVAGAMDVSTASRLTTLPIWAFHGDADDLVYPNEVREMYSILQSRGGRMSYTEYPGIGHDSWTQTFRDTQVLDWLFRQSL